MAQIGAVFNELERALIAERTSDALAELRQQGRPWNHPPFGWTVADGRLEPVPVEQDTLARARELRAAGMAYNRIAAQLTAEGHRAKRAAAWSAMSVRSVLNTSAKLADLEPAVVTS